MPFILPDTDLPDTMILSKQSIIRKLIANFQQLLFEFTHFVLMGICFMLSLIVIPSCIEFLLMVPIFLLTYSFIVYIAYACLMTNVVDRTQDSWHTTLAMALFARYAKYVGHLLGGTQWLIIVLRQFGARIGNDVILDDINSLYDVYLITIGSHTRLSSTCQIQV